MERGAEPDRVWSGLVSWSTRERTHMHRTLQRALAVGTTAALALSALFVARRQADALYEIAPSGVHASRNGLQPGVQRFAR